MLYIIIGSDPKARAIARHKVWEGAMQDIDAAGMPIEELAALAATDSLFGEARGYRMQDIFALPEDSSIAGDSFLGIAEDLVASPHTFILEEEKLLAKPKTALERAGAKLAELKAEPKKAEFNVFAIGNALGHRDRKQLWLLLMAALEAGIAPENVSGILAWKARTMAVSARSEADRKTWARMSRELVVIYHESHRGMGDLGLLLERFALTI
jgi:hypothetical protein